MVTINWQEPPFTESGPSATAKWDDVREALRKKPGKWALIAPGCTTSLASQWRKSPSWAWFELTCRRGDNPRGKADIYARYVGSAS